MEEWSDACPPPCLPAGRVRWGDEGYFSVKMCAMASAILALSMSIAFLTAMPFRSVPADAAVAEVFGIFDVSVAFTFT